MDNSEILNHLGENREKYFSAVAPPIVQSSNFCFSSIEDMQQRFLHEFDSYLYSRGNNPTVEILRTKLAALENCEEALVFSSGSGAIACALSSLLKSGDHVICVKKPYGWTKKLLSDFLHRFGVETTFVDGKNVENFKAAKKQNTKLLFLESPNSWTFEMQPLKEIATWAKQEKLLSIVDNSYSSPIGQKPADLGIDLICHSATKYISGHSDVVAGCLMGSSLLIRQIFKDYMTLGSVTSAHDAALLLRGLRTLPLRYERSSQTALKLCEHFEKHSKVKKIFYPFLKSSDQFELAKKQMTTSGGLFTIEFDSENTVQSFAEKCKTFLLGVSWGGYESLMMPALGMKGPTSGTLPDGLNTSMVRFYVGLEDFEYLKKDLENSLAD